MRIFVVGLAVALSTLAFTTVAQVRDPFPPIQTQPGVVVGAEEFASLPFIDYVPAQMRSLVYEPGSDKLLVSDMRGFIYALADDGTATLYLDLTDPRWGTGLSATWREEGLLSFALHPQFAQQGASGYGKIYAWFDVGGTDAEVDFDTHSAQPTHQTVLMEWTASDAGASTFVGSGPRELMRLEQPYRNHNGGAMAFNPIAEPGDADYGLLYIGNGDGGDGGDPLGLAQNMGSIYGKILRIDPLGNNSDNGQYGIPSDNPFVGREGALPEIFAYGLRNPQQIAWDSETGVMMYTDIGQDAVEEVSLVAAGDNLGWNIWEAGFRFISREGVSLDNPRSDPDVRYPFVEFDHIDPLLSGSVAATGLAVVRADTVPALEDRILFGELASGEVFYVNADNRPNGGNAAMRRVLFDDGTDEPKTFLQLVQAKNIADGRPPAFRTDLRIRQGAEGDIYLLNKYDGVVRRLVPRS